MKTTKSKILKRKTAPTWSGVYLKIPTEVIQRYRSSNVREQRLGRILVSLFSHIYFQEGALTYNDRIYSCKRGEYIGAMNHIERSCALPENSIYGYLRILERENLITIQRLTRCTRVQIVGFDDFMLGSNLGVAKKCTLPINEATPAIKSLKPAAIPVETDERNYYRDVLLPEKERLKQQIASADPAVEKC